MMSTWKKKQIESKGRASRTSSGLAKVYRLAPPPEGWVGGADAKKINSTGKKIPI